MFPIFQSHMHYTKDLAIPPKTLPGVVRMNREAAEEQTAVYERRGGSKASDISFIDLYDAISLY